MIGRASTRNRDVYRPMLQVLRARASSAERASGTVDARRVMRERRYESSGTPRRRRRQALCGRVTKASSAAAAAAAVVPAASLHAHTRTHVYSTRRRLARPWETEPELLSTHVRRRRRRPRTRCPRYVHYYIIRASSLLLLLLLYYNNMRRTRPRRVTRI